MKIDPVLNKNYEKALEMITNAFSIETKRVKVYAADETFFYEHWLNELKLKFGDIEVIKNHAKMIAKNTKGMYLRDKNIIVIREDAVDDLATVIHETLHSLSPLDPKKVPLKISEALTRTLTKHLLSKIGLKIEDLYLKEWTEFWEGVKEEKGINTLCDIYFAEDLDHALKKSKKFIS